MTRRTDDIVRVAYCIDSFEVGGTELNAVRTAEALDKSRFALTVFHFKKDGPLRSRYESLRIPMEHIPIAGFASLSTARQAMHFGARLRNLGAQVVHAHDLYTNIFAAPTARLLSQARVIASRRWWFDSPRPALVPMNRFAYKFAHRILANSSGVARLLAEVEHIPLPKIAEIPNFLEDRAFEMISTELRAEQRRRWGVPDHAFVVGIVARLAPVKNHAMLLRAAADLDARFHFVIVGDGPSRADLTRLASELGLDARVHFVGEIISERNLHQFFDASVLCSLSEGFPNSIIEALAVARPVVATAVGGVEDIVKHRQTGLLVPSSDAAALATALRTLRDDPELRHKLGSSGQIATRSQFHQSVVMEKLSSLYTELASECVHRI